MKPGTTLLFPDDATEVLHRVLRDLPASERWVDALRPFLRGSGMKGDAGPSLGWRAPTLAERVKAARDEVVRLEWDRDDLIAAFGPDAHSEAETIVDRFLVAKKQALGVIEAELGRESAKQASREHPAAGEFESLLPQSTPSAFAVLCATPPRDARPSDGPAADPDARTNPAAPPATTIESERLRHGDDFSWMVVKGRRFSFSRPQQALVIKTLFAQWQKSGRLDGSGLREQTIGAAIDSSRKAFRIRRVFDGHDAVNSILRSAAKGEWALYLNEPGW
ncbi:MAG: hypothetical protein IT459_13075 [Planctomycetes bacterium]|nr:hypothetical protein [Planctomycetota bacterium]